MQNSLFKKIDEAIVQALIQLLVESKLFIFFDHMTVGDSNVKTIDVLRKSFRLKLFKNVDR